MLDQSRLRTTSGPTANADHRLTPAGALYHRNETDLHVQTLDVARGELQ
jgi:hypothetical protein